MQRVLENYELKELLALRYLNKQISGDVFSRCVKNMICNLSEAGDEEDEYTFHKILRNPKKVEI